MAAVVPFVGGNWKCNMTLEESSKLVTALNAAQLAQDIEVVICPTFLHIEGVKRALTHPKMTVAAQNCTVKCGAFTGEVSASQLADAGLKWVILGHSERRHIYGETDKVVAEKVAAALGAGVGVIACIGEKLEEREAGQTMAVCIRQLQAISESVNNWDNVVVAYEPVWAIGTGKAATSDEAQEVHANVRQWMRDNLNKDIASKVRIIYGGSVNEKNAVELYGKPDINGFLVGGAALKPTFVEIALACNKSKTHS